MELIEEKNACSIVLNYFQMHNQLHLPQNHPIFPFNNYDRNRFNGTLEKIL